LTCRFEGASVGEIIERLWPLLSQWTERSKLLAALPDYHPDEVSALLDEWADAGLLRSRTGPPAASSHALSALTALGFDEDHVAERMSRLRLGLFGDGSLAARIAEALESAGYARVDCHGTADAEQETALSRERVEALAGSCDLVIAAFDRGWLAARHWVNRAALATGRPALFAETELSRALVGPLVLPGEGPCYMCYRMRRIAMSDTFSEAFAYEQHLDGLRRANPERPVLPGLCEAAAGLVVTEATRLLFDPLVAGLVGRVVELDGLSYNLRRHEVLPRPDCPHCKDHLSAAGTP
jgi:ribosomal protein S12 methylthiotransferase accessory factor